MDISKASIYKQKIDYYQNMLNNNILDIHTNNLCKYKLNKYKMKLAKIEPIIDCKLLRCGLKYEENRNPSYCDRILYKGDIKISNYDVYESDFIKYSDHLMVYGIFSHNNEKGIILTWNIGKLHEDKDITCGINKLLTEFDLLKTEIDYDYIVFCLQESPDNDNFIKILVKLFNKQYKVSINSSNSLTGQNVRLVVFHKVIGISLDKVSNYKIQLNKDIESRVKYLGSGIKKILGTKAYVMIKINDITFISCHLPINVKIDDPNNYLGNNLRIDALNEIIKDLIDHKNVIIIGDLNFRNTPKDQKDQLKELLPNINEYKEFGTLLKHTCKVISCDK
jgi:exonuclease III